MKLPEKLGKEPIMEALFDMRFKSKSPIANILPGLILSKFEGESRIEKLSNFDLPESLLMQLDVNLRYAPVVKVHWQNYTILCSNRSVGLSCKLPYPGWASAFKPTILKLMDLINGVNVIEVVERFSLKYLNVFSDELGAASSVVDLMMKIGPYDVANNIFQTRAEIRKDNLVSIIQVAAEGTVTLADGTKRKGVLVDVDTIAMFKDLPFADFFNGLSDQLETVHTEVKVIFFSCLKPDTVTKLEPEYG